MVLLVGLAAGFAGFQLFSQFSKPKPAQEALGLGTTTGNVYSHDKLGFSVSIPSDWSVGTQETMAEVTEMGSKLMGDNEKAVAEAMQMNVARLLFASRLPQGAFTLEFNDNLIVMAERVIDVSFLPKSEDDYLDALLLQLNASNLSYDEISKKGKREAGGVALHRMDSEMSLAGQRILQEYYVIRRDSYFVALIMSYEGTRPQWVVDVLDSVTFE